jgi:hypothetical protein
VTGGTGNRQDSMLSLLHLACYMMSQMQGCMNTQHHSRGAGVHEYPVTWWLLSTAGVFLGCDGKQGLGRWLTAVNRARNGPAVGREGCSDGLPAKCGQVPRCADGQGLPIGKHCL